jgi:hypothetical protein
MVEHGIAVEAVEGETQVKPAVQAVQATRSWPSVPTERLAGVLAAVAATIEPFAVSVEQGMAVEAVAGETQVSPVAQALQATNS